MALNNDLTGVQKGDTLLIEDGPTWRVRTVERVTPTQVIIRYDTFDVRYRKQDGSEVGKGAYYGERAYIWDAAAQEHFAALQVKSAQRRLAAILNGLEWRNVPASVTLPVAELLVAADIGADKVRDALDEVRKTTTPAR